VKEFPSRSSLDKILTKAEEETPLTNSELLTLLSLQSPSELNRLFSTARNLRQRYFGEKVFLYGFIYFSTYCRNNCIFCASRASNQTAKRYRKTEDEVIDAALRLAESGVHLMDLTMGEDPFYCRSDDRYKALLELTVRVKSETGLPVMISPGVVPHSLLTAFAREGIEWYACYQETHNRELFADLRPGQDYDSRLSTKYFAHETGLLIEEGILTGVGESLADIVNSIRAMQTMNVDQARIMRFIPQAGTPMEFQPVSPKTSEMKTIAVFRLVFPDRLIPASLDIDGLENLAARLQAGANVITSLIPPFMDLSGVSQSSLGIEEGIRSVTSVLPVLEELHLHSGTPSDYIGWIKNTKSSINAQSLDGRIAE